VNIRVLRNTPLGKKTLGIIMQAVKPLGNDIVIKQRGTVES